MASPAPPKPPRMFAVLGLSHQEKIAEAIKQHYPEDHYVVSRNQWLIVTRGTAQSVSDTLGISEAETGTGIVVMFSSYFGRASTQIWEWLAAKMGTDVG